ncbi:Dyp-type peroxidase [Dellaglioa carnosa]|uniref:Dyp-type peroxidase n=1 Tax=Dellaglioa carnosa TaxID=2995136 RepID=A0ABT4JLU4_9LACO|nr:Dyp-type peroxidase [Dellaglioa carnosa]MCZ2491326.1 Dyp-type peroxidase [Dellaglioa carnosa]MCZ2494404.1 Dyp-type peroxidase [Dellaglioa carnosa]MDK1731180.1 Dyp-type peroxidase [Dellaglioa carnosa]
MTVTEKLTQDVYKDVGENVNFTILNLNHKDQKAELAAVQELADRIPAIIRSMNVRYPKADLKIAFGFGSDAWDYLFPDAIKPMELIRFKEIVGPKYTAISTPGDLFFHVRAGESAVVYEVMAQFMLFIKDATTVEDETHGFRYFEGRAVIGFIDGTENPDVNEALDYAVIGDEDPEFTNGSYAFAQKYRHDMTAWNALKTEDQEKAIGRKKDSDLELADEEKLPNSHNVASQDMKDGIEHKIVRMNVPFSEPGKDITGTYFIGYARHFAVTNRMLINMFESKSDRLLDFSTAETGNLFFIPSTTTLESIVDNDL